MIESNDVFLWLRFGELTALLYKKVPNSQNRYKNTNKVTLIFFPQLVQFKKLIFILVHLFQFFPWKLVCSEGEESNFLEFRVKLSGEETNDMKLRTEIQLCDTMAADELCILNETYSTTLPRFPSYIPKPMIKSWIAKEVTDESIMSPTM
jgi:hypothetical protein